MILQCDQCHTKFRLDDSKLKPGGVKVRCSKCRHVFLAGAEQKQEESEFDALLSGLGGPAPEKPAAAAPAKDAAALFGFDEPAAAVKAPEPPPQPTPAAVPQPEPPASQPDLSELASFEVPADAFPTQEKGAPADIGGAEAAQAAPAAQDLGFGEFAFSEETAPEQTVEAERGTGLDFGELSFEEEAKGEEAKGEEAKGEEPPAAGAGAFDFSEFDFDSSPVTAGEQPQATAEALDFGEFAFNEEPAPAKAPGIAQPADALDFGEISFEEEPPSAGAAAPAGAAADDLGFGEFSFDEEPAPAGAPEQAPAASDALDFGEFSFEEPAAAGAPVQAPAGSDAFDFSEFSFDEEPAQPAAGEAEPAAGGFGELSLEPSAKGPQPEPSGGIDALDFGDFSFEEEPTAAKEEASPGAPEFDFGDFTFSEEPPPVAEEPAAAEDFGSFSFEEEPKQKPAEPPLEGAGPAAGAMPGAAGEENVDAAFIPGVAGVAGAVMGAAAGQAAQRGGAAPEAAVPPVSSAASAAKPAEKESSLDFAFGGLPEDFGEDEELPPLGITSRRKGRSALTVTILVVSVLVILALSAAGIYVMKSGPEAMKKLDQYGIGFVADWFGIQSPEQGRITIKNPVASFHQNKEAGELFVVTGEAVNSFKEARASVQVKVNVYDKSGAVLMQKTAYCGNRLTNEQLATLPLEKIESIMNNQFGDSLSNLGIKPGQGIGFVVAMANVPKEAADFGVEVVGSTVAGQ